MITKRFIGKNLIELKSIDSTNNYLSNFVNKSKLLNGTVILAHNQTEGKGQRGNQWESEDGKNLTFSIFLKSDFIPIDKSFLLSMATCNAIHKIVSSKVSNAKIKWPNDILVGKNKICGILIENSIQGDKLNNSIIGIGLNVNQEKFSINSNITSIKLESKTNHNKSQILDEFFSILEKEIRLIVNKKTAELKQYYFDKLLGYNYHLEYINTKTDILFSGKIINVEDNGLVEIETDTNEKLVFEMKEIKLFNFSS